MNGYTKSIPPEECIKNILAVFPEEIRPAIICETLPDDGNIHTWLRRMTGAAYKYIAARSEWGKRKCVFCGAEITEEYPIMAGVCDDCFRGKVVGAALARKQAEEACADLERLGALQYGDADLGTRFIISGGEALEIPPSIFGGREEDMPF